MADLLRICDCHGDLLFFHDLENDKYVATIRPMLFVDLICQKHVTRDLNQGDTSWISIPKLELLDHILWAYDNPTYSSPQFRFYQTQYVFPTYRTGSLRK